VNGTERGFIESEDRFPVPFAKIAHSIKWRDVEDGILTSSGRNWGRRFCWRWRVLGRCVDRSQEPITHRRLWSVVLVALN